MSLDSNQNRLEFLLRHVDDEPAIADYRSLAEVIQAIAQTAVNFAVIGQVDGATKLLETLINRAIDPFEYCDTCYPYLKPCMYFAWEANSSWPSWIPQEERAEEKLLEMEQEGRKIWLQRFSQEWEVTEETASKALDMAYNGLTTELPDYNGTLAGQVAVVEKMSQDGIFSYSASPNGPMSARYLKIAMWWRQGIFPYPYVQLYRTAGLMIALDIYARLNHDTEARDVFDKICGRIEAYEMIEQLACSRLAWSKFILTPQQLMLEMLNIHPAKVRPATSRAVQMAQNRLETGPRRRYLKQSIGELVHTISKNTFGNCPYDALDIYRPSDELRFRPDSTDGLLRQGCSSADIAALEKRLEISLPEEYKEFLAVTNGLEAIWNGQNALNYLAKAEDVCWQDLDFLEGNEIPLLHDDEPQPHAGNMLSWPTPESPRCICLSGHLDQHEATAHLFLIGPDIVKPAKDCFFSAYQERNESQRSELDNLVQETYGSMDVFRDLEYVLMCWTPWDLRYYPFKGIRDFLEQMAEASLQKNQDWLHVFEPRFRRLMKNDE